MLTVFSTKVCLPHEYFCDGSVDCADGSDEGYCDPNNDPNAAETCDLSVCQLPECFCSKDATHIPGDLEPIQTPQMVILTFDDAINIENFQLYTEKIFTENRTNPNGCPIKGTFFVSHQYTDYQKVQKLWQEGHEIAIHSITHRGPEDWWKINATIEDYFDEFVGQANIINKFANVRMEEIEGELFPIDIS
jgi:Low-density lipoprotein receptor domain class A/Polysaccharide deacetylase